MTTVTGTNTRSTIWNNFKAFLGATTFTDTPTIRAAYNDKSPSFPMILLHAANVPKDKICLNGTAEERKDCSIMVEVHANDSLKLDRIIDEFDAKLVASASVLENDGIQFKANKYWDESIADTYMINNQKIHMKVVTINFEI